MKPINIIEYKLEQENNESIAKKGASEATHVQSADAQPSVNEQVSSHEDPNTLGTNNAVINANPPMEGIHDEIIHSKAYQESMNATQKMPSQDLHNSELPQEIVEDDNKQTKFSGLSDEKDQREAATAITKPDATKIKIDPRIKPKHEIVFYRLNKPLRSGWIGH